MTGFRKGDIVCIKDPEGFLREMAYPRCLDAVSSDQEATYEILSCVGHTARLQALTGFYAYAPIQFNFHTDRFTKVSEQTNETTR